jgi:hypothetical protein
MAALTSDHRGVGHVFIVRQDEPVAVFRHLAVRSLE